MRELAKRNLTTPTPIQAQAIPTALEGKDVIGIAQTGTGKTFAFGIPMLQRIFRGEGRGLVIVPTRELAYQVEESLLTFAPALGIRTAVLVGGEPARKQQMAIRKNPYVVIATPGRLNDFLNQGLITLKEVKTLVLDEADRMFDMGFKPQIDDVLRRTPKERQTMLFSATMPPEIMQLAQSEMQLPLRIEVAPAGTTARDIEQEIILVHKAQKTALLLDILTKQTGTVLVFSRTKHGAKKITRDLLSAGHSAAEIHSNKSLAQRREALAGFKSGRYRVLVATDIAARGIDVKDIKLVLNYDLPDDPSDYVHRIGRTARAGKAGLAVSFATAEQKGCIREIERLIRRTLPKKRSEGTGEPVAIVESPEDTTPSSPRSGNSRPSRGGSGQRRGPSRPGMGGAARNGFGARRRMSGKSFGPRRAGT